MLVVLKALLALHFISSCYCLECYVCSKQDSNTDKCVLTAKICDVADNRCLTEVRWGSTPYWEPQSKKQYYISKRCATKEICNEAMRARRHRCDRIGYNDWECVECCTGDRCNYYVTLGAAQRNACWMILLSGLMTAFFLRR